MNFIELTASNDNDRKKWVNMDLIVSVAKHEWGASLRLLNDRFILVRETPEKIMECLGVRDVAPRSKTWLERTNPNWVYATLFVAVMALLMSPFVEEKRWPLSAWFTPALSDVRR